jgi:hypothetical protein
MPLSLVFKALKSILNQEKCKQRCKNKLMDLMLH